MAIFKRKPYGALTCAARGCPVTRAICKTALFACARFILAKMKAWANGTII
jgi:hypothetical protein